MFKGLRDKLKNVLNKFSKEVEEEAVEEIVEEVKEKQVVEEQPVVEKEVAQEPVPEQEIPAEEPVPKEKEEIKEAAPVEPEQEVVEETILKEEPAEEPAPKPKAPVKETLEEPTSAEEQPEEQAQETTTEEPALEEPEEPKEEKRSFLGKLFKKKEKEEVSKPEEEPAAEKKSEPVVEEKQKKESFFTKITKITLSEEKFENLFWDIEVTLLENNVAVEVIEKIKADLKAALTGEKMSRKSVEDIIKETLHNTIKEILSVEPVDLLKKCEEKQPLIITMIGVNGSGKTTTLAKLVKYFQDNDKSVVVAAADTFRAAAIQQVEEHTTNLGVKLIKHDYNADPAAVAFDAVKHATAKGLDVVIIDSAGRLHSNDNLMNELKKLIRINKPDINLFVGEAITGNDCVEQAKLFDEAVGIDAIILAKADVDEKGGAAISASYVTKKPVIFLGTGQTYDDLTPFKPEVVLESLGL